ncbi:MAG: DUF4860 domain-containing protein, partial [Ruminococcaceae bacterium]|nr:DUF4860 domain-containing protein [Oscillospiraceae bacterium]
SYGENDALVFTELVESTPYETWIYAEDGKLCEVTVKSRSDISSGAGQEISRVSSLEVEPLGGGLYRISVTDEENAKTDALVFLRCKQEGGAR